MKLLTCAGYYSTGSSAVTDLVNECDNVHYMGDYEFRFVQDPDGICDLEYNLVINNHRHNSGYAIKRYERNVDFLAGNRLIKKYNSFFGDKWKEFSREYVSNLILAEYPGYWHQELRDLGPIAYFLERSVNRIMHDFFKMSRDKQFALFLNHNTNYATYPSEQFYTYTKSYIDKLFSYANNDNKEFVMADQLVPPSNIDRYSKFFNSIKVVCVDRDPRDVYIHERMNRGAVVPKDVHQYCVWYKTIRLHRKDEIDDPSIVMRINFEDLIYNYQDMVEKVFGFYGIEAVHHTKPGILFNPDRSIKNTQLFKKYPEFSKEVEIIEKELSEYLYDYKHWE